MRRIGLSCCLAAVTVLAMTACAPDSQDPSAVDDSRAVVVEIDTELGLLVVELYPSKAPVTVANFLRYVDAGHYDAGVFYRAVRLDNQAPSDVPIQVVQGGTGLAEHPDDQAEPPFPPIAHENTRATGLSHRDGALSMARSDPGSASSEFFFAVGDNTALDFGGDRNPDGQGFAVFGQLIAGRDVLTALHRRRSDRVVSPDLEAVQGQMLNEPVRFQIHRR